LDGWNENEITVDTGSILSKDKSEVTATGYLVINIDDIDEIEAEE